MSDKECKIHPLQKGYLDDKFILGPLPLNWFGRVTQLGGKHTMTVALMIWYLRGMKVSRVSVTKKGQHDVVWMNYWLADKFNVSPISFSRALKRLVEAGLIRYVKTGKGQRPVIKIIWIKQRKTKEV